MKTSVAGRAAIRAREGDRLKAYKDGGGVLTIGVGHTSAAGPPEVTAGMKITAAESDAILARDLADVEADVTAKVKVALNQNQFDALVSLVFNIGGTAFRKSTLLKKLNAGDYAGAAAQFARWNKDNGKTVAGLTTRRAQERDQFLSGGKAPAPVKPKPVKVPPAPGDIYSTKEMVQVVQALLTEKGYPLGSRDPTTGQFDGVLGTLTKSSIRDARADNGLPEGEGIDAELLAALPTIPQRKLAPARENAPTEKAAENAPETAANWRTEVLAKYGAAGAFVLAILDWITKQFAAGQEALQPVLSFAASIPLWVWLMVAVVILVALWWNHRGGRLAGVEAFRTGARL